MRLTILANLAMLVLLVGCGRGCPPYGTANYTDPYCPGYIGNGYQTGYPNGTYPPGTYPPGAYPPGTYSPGTYAPGTYPPNMYPPGTVPLGTYPPGGYYPPNCPPNNPACAYGQQQ